jgi:hypothetical protein
VLGSLTCKSDLSWIALAGFRINGDPCSECNCADDEDFLARNGLGEST